MEKTEKNEQKALGGGKAFLNSIIQEGLTERLEQRHEEVEEISHVDICRECVAGRTKSKCAEMQVCLMRNCKKDSVSAAE